MPSSVEVGVAVVQRKSNVGSVTKEFHPCHYQVMLVETMVTSHANFGKPVCSLPKFPLQHNIVPQEVILDYLYLMTRDKSGGIKGERAIRVHLSSDASDYRDSFSSMGLYCVPLNHKYNVNLEKSSTAHVAFVSLDDALSGNSKFTCTQTTLTLLLMLKIWLAEKHRQDGSIQCIFRIRAEYRISICINNPVFIPRSKEQTSIDGRNTANFDALTKMLAIEKCDTVVMNPLFGSDLLYNAKSNVVVSNIYWSRGIPDYPKIIAYHKAALESKRDMDPVWARNYPIHKCAFEGDVAGINARLSQFSHSMKDDKSAAPIHYAAWRGHTEAVVALLKAGCSPNITNKDLQTPLHIAAKQGHPQVVNVLLEDSDIDVNPQDKTKKTPYDLCYNETEPEFLKAANLLSAAMDRPSQKIEIHLMGGGKKTLNLTAGDNTTVSHFKEQMLRELDMPESYGNIFSIWICSQNLELQLKLNHKPVIQLHKWKPLVRMMTESDPELEKPILEWRRNAKVNLQEEKQLLMQVQHEVGIQLLFHEASHRYISGLYIFNDQSVFAIAAGLLYISCGYCSVAEARSHCSANLSKFVPTVKLHIRGTNWVKEIIAQYKLLLEERSLDMQTLKLQFIRKCQSLQVYGSAFFNGTLQLRPNQQTLCHIGVNGLGIHLINTTNKAVNQSHMYRDINWYHPTEDSNHRLEIRLKSSSQTTILLHTKVAGLIDHLMKKMSNWQDRNGMGHNE